MHACGIKFVGINVRGTAKTVNIYTLENYPLYSTCPLCPAPPCSMLLRRGADSSCEDMNRCVPSFVARRLRYHECRQVITQFQMERVTRLAREASDVSFTKHICFTYFQV